MKKPGTLFTTTLLTLGLMLVAPTTMAKPKQMDNGSEAAYTCFNLKQFSELLGVPALFPWKNHGQCVKQFTQT